MFKYPAKILLLIYFIILSSIIISSCEQAHIEEKQIIATVDGEEITLEEFKLFYELDPNFGLDSSGLPALKDELFYFAHQKLALRKAENEGLTTDPVFKMAIEWEKKQAMLREFYRLQILNSIEISEEELRKIYENENVQVHVQQLFSKTRMGIDIIQEELRNGKTFHEIALFIYKDSTLAANGGDLGWLKAGELEEKFSDAVLLLKKDEISPVVETKFGFHIIKLVNRKSQKMLSESEYLTRRSSLEKKVRQSKSMDASRKYISEFMKNKNPQLDPGIFLAFWNVLVPNQENENAELPGKVFVTNDAINTCLEVLKPLLQNDLVKSEFRSIKLEEYLSALKTIPTSNRPGFKSQRELSHQIATWVRDDLLFEECRDLGLDNSKNVLAEVKRYKEEQSYHYFLQQHVEETQIPDYVDAFYRTKDLSILEQHSLLRHFNTKQEWQWFVASRKLKDELSSIPSEIKIDENLLSTAEKSIDWDRRIRMFMIRKPQ